MEKEKQQREKSTKKNKLKIKEYLRDFLLFIDKNVWKTMRILMVITVLLIAISIKSLTDYTSLLECEGSCLDKATVWSDYGSNISVLLVTLAAGLVPYIYVPIVGFVGYITQELTGITVIIKELGVLKGLVVGIIPLLLNLIIICLITAVAIYICKSRTTSYRISNMQNMNFTNFRISLYESLGKKEKVQALVKKKEEKLNKLQAKKEKLNYLQILNVIIVAGILEFIAVAIQHILV